MQRLRLRKSLSLSSSWLTTQLELDEELDELDEVLDDELAVPEDELSGPDELLKLSDQLGSLDNELASRDNELGSPDDELASSDEDDMLDERLLVDRLPVDDLPVDDLGLLLEVLDVLPAPAPPWPDDGNELHAAPPTIATIAMYQTPSILDLRIKRLLSSSDPQSPPRTGVKSSKLRRSQSPSSAGWPTPRWRPQSPPRRRRPAQWQ